MEARLIEKRIEAPDTLSFFWQTNTPIKFIPGQYFYFTLPKLDFPDTRGPTRHFTISSSPTEGNLLRITTRIRQKSGYKKTLQSLPLKTVINCDGPQGVYVFPQEASDINFKHIFLAGGIGITPFRSIIKFILDKGYSTNIFLIYSNSDSNFIFKEEWDNWATQNVNIKIAYYDSSANGHLNKSVLQKFISKWDIASESFIPWLAGPAAFVNGISQELESIGIKSEKIRTEKFTGY